MALTDWRGEPVRGEINWPKADPMGLATVDVQRSIYLENGGMRTHRHEHSCSRALTQVEPFL